MPQVIVEILDIIEPPVPNGTGLGVFQHGGGPGTVNSAGQIDIHGEAPNVDIVFKVIGAAQAAKWVFASPGFTAQASDILPFGLPTNDAGNTECTVQDANEKATYKYTLRLVNLSNPRFVTLDPFIINK